MQRRRGVTRIEVIVSLLAATLLVGCFLAAMFRIHSEADMMTCKSKLRQLSLAIDNYHSTNDALPSLVDIGERAPTGEMLASPFATLEPFIESTPLLWRPKRDPPSAYHGHSSVEIPWKDKDGTPRIHHGGIVNQVWQVFLDPSDRTAENLREVPMTLPDGTTGYYATGSYASNGLLPWGVKRPRDSFPGGLSNTILFAERPQVSINADGETIYNLWGVGFYSPHMPAFATLTPTEPAGLWSTNQIAPVLPLSESDGPVPIRIGRQDAPIDANGAATPFQRVRPGRPCDARLPGTPHSRGMQVAMCDGSVRVFSHETNAWVFWKACVPATE